MRALQSKTLDNPSCAATGYLEAGIDRAPHPWPVGGPYAPPPVGCSQSRADTAG